MDIRAIPVVDENHNVTMFVEWVRDITEEKDRQKRLERSEEEHRRLFETMSPGVVYHSADGTIIAANPAAEAILGLTVDQMNGKTTMDPRWKMVDEAGNDVPGSEHPAMITLRTGEKGRSGRQGCVCPGTRRIRLAFNYGYSTFQSG